jgi:ornithine decarboxylase
VLSIEQMKKHFDVQKLETPFLVIDKRIIKRKFREIKDSVKGVKVFYAVKANSNLEISRYLDSLGAGFEVASTNELKDLLAIGVSAKKIITSNTLKIPEFIKAAHQAGVEYFAYDTEMEIDKLSALAPGSKVYLRIVVDNTGSEWPLSKKFGADPSRALELLKYAKNSKVTPVGITFHVGSQCLNPLNWSNALITTAEIFNMARRAGIELKLVNLGGGIPVKHIKKTPKLAEIKWQIEKILNEAFADYPELELMIEPGRAVVGDSGNLVTSVIAKAERGGENWLYVDVGVFNGLMESIEGFSYEIVSELELSGFVDRGDFIPYTIAGPSCDSVDTMFKDYYLPKNLDLGDRLYIKNAGAYTLSYASNFNGLEPPKVYFIEDK